MRSIDAPRRASETLRAPAERWLSIAIPGLLAAALVACGDVPAFECDFDSECSGGVCTDDGYCARKDLSCPTTLRYDDSAGEGLGGQCVDPNAGATGDTADDPIKLVDTRTVDISDASDDTEASCARSGGRDIFFEITLDIPAHLGVDTIGTTFAVDLAVRSGTCASHGTELDCDQTTCNPKVQIYEDLLDAGTYCIIADERPGVAGNGTELVIHAEINGFPSCAAAR